ncbi:hypothetical protein M2318_005114 [Metapseudomonas resinovorans]|uniref:hypothetical protein n=1 Tax=Metapseudomonas resinovorans TaxID=53412 RepID=UPI003D253212
MKRRLHAYSIGVAMAGLLSPLTFDVPSEIANDPHKPRPRSKGEKARNRRNRHG